LKEWVPGVRGFIDNYYKGGAELGAYFVEGSDDSYAIIDPSTKKAAKLVLEFWKLSKRPKELKYIILTHAHPDHYGGVPFLKRKVPSAQLVVHETATRVLKEGKEALLERFPYAASDAFPTSRMSFRSSIASGITPDLEVKDATLELGDNKILLQETGGHCEDHLLAMYISKDSKALFLGDEAHIYPNNPYSFFMDSTGSFTKHQKIVQLLENVSTDVIIPAHISPIFNQGSDLFEAAQEMRFSLEHVRKTIYDIIVEKGGEKEWFIRERVFKTLQKFHWDGPFFAWAVGSTTIHVMLKSLADEGKVKYNTAREKWIPT